MVCVFQSFHQEDQRKWFQNKTVFIDCVIKVWHWTRDILSCLFLSPFKSSWNIYSSIYFKYIWFGYTCSVRWGHRYPDGSIFQRHNSNSAPFQALILLGESWVSCPPHPPPPRWASDLWCCLDPLEIWRTKAQSWALLPDITLSSLHSSRAARSWIFSKII